jgi:glycosyltransferase involved in cell wall biosynthesis
MVLHATEPMHAFEKRIPFIFRGLFLKKVFAWLVLIREARKYDWVLCRHMVFDPFVFIFGWFVPNRISVHHAKETEELKLVRKGWRGRAAALLERLAGWCSARQVCGMLGVTEEIARNQADLHNVRCPVGIYPNGVDLGAIGLLADRRTDDVNFAFVAGTFSSWQGLDRLITAFRNAPAPFSEVRATVHLIGAVDRSTAAQVEAFNKEKAVFVVHGPMHQAEYGEILAQCDVGLDSFGIDRKGLSEGAALKVREYLAQGLPVFSVHGDAAMPQGHPFYRQGDLNAMQMIDFARAMKCVSRQAVREGSAEYISKVRMMESVHAWLEKEVARGEAAQVAVSRNVGGSGK